MHSPLYMYVLYVATIAVTPQFCVLSAAGSEGQIYCQLDVVSRQITWTF